MVWHLRAGDALAKALTDKPLGEVNARTGMMPQSSTPAALRNLDAAYQGDGLPADRVRSGLSRLKTR